MVTIRSMGDVRRFLPSLRESMALWPPWFQTSSLQHCETMHVWAFKPPPSCYFVPAALGDEYQEAQQGIVDIGDGHGKGEGWTRV